MLNIHFAGTSLRSEVTSVDHPDLTFVVSLIRTTPTFDKSEQVWELVSDIAVSMTTFYLAFISFRGTVCTMYT